MTLQVLPQDNLADFVARLMQRQEVVGPVAQENQHVFAPISDPADLALDYVFTVLPPKKYLLPQRETLLRFSLGDEVRVEPVVEAEPRIIFGVHTCDLHGLAQLDRAFADAERDTNYLARRAATTLIGLDDMPDEHCFCASVGTATVQTGFDLFLTPLEGEYAVEVGTERGAELLEQCAETTAAQAHHIAGVKEHLDRKIAAQESKLDCDFHTLPLLLDASWDSPVWQKWADQCYSCGSCNLVCPTCFCFDVQDKMELNLTDGERGRIWDGCLLNDFAAVASGENFREDRLERLRHRFYRKFAYLYTKFGEPFCTGCGRCGRACVPNITVPAVLNDLVAAERKEGVKHGV